jgi:hypothetical protein
MWKPTNWQWWYRDGVIPVLSEDPADLVQVRILALQALDRLAAIQGSFEPGSIQDMQAGWIRECIEKRILWGSLTPDPLPTQPSRRIPNAAMAMLRPQKPCVDPISKKPISFWCVR